MALFSRTHLVAGTQLMAPLLESQPTSAAESFSAGCCCEVLPKQPVHKPDHVGVKVLQSDF